MKFSKPLRKGVNHLTVTVSYHKSTTSFFHTPLPFAASSPPQTYETLCSTVNPPPNKVGMPRRKSDQLISRPFGFSSFARSVSMVATAKSLKQKASDSDFDDKSSSKFLANEAGKRNFSENDPQSDSSEEETSEGEIQADFAFFDPKPNDFHGVKALLQGYLDDKEWDLSGFVDIILTQTTVGSVVKIEDDEDEAVFAFLTALNLGRHKDHKCIAELKAYLLKVCHEKALVGKLKALVEDQAQHVGLVVSQRVTNLPPQLLPHLYDALFDEISWAMEDEPTEDLRKSFQFRHYIILTRIYKKTAQNRKGVTSSSAEAIIYVKAEDELFHELCSWSFTFSLKTMHPAAQELKGYQMMGLVMAVEAGKAKTFRQKLRSLIDNS